MSVNFDPSSRLVIPPSDSVTTVSSVEEPNEMIAEYRPWRRNWKEILPASIPQGILSTAGVILSAYDYLSTSAACNEAYQDLVFRDNTIADETCGWLGCYNEDLNQTCTDLCSSQREAEGELWESNFYKLNGADNTAWLLGLSSSVAIPIAVLNYQVLSRQSSPCILKVTSVANIVFGIGLFASGMAAPATVFANAAPVAIAAGSCFMASGAYFALKAYGGLGSMFSKVTECYRKRFPWQPATSL